MGERISIYRVLVQKPEGKRQHENPSCILQENIKMDFKEVNVVELT